MTRKENIYISSFSLSHLLPKCQRMNAHHVESVHVGTPPTGYQEWTTTKVHVHGFANLSTRRNVYFASPEFMALGNPWRLKLYPGGDSNSKAGWVAIYLINRSSKEIDIDFGFSINDGNGKQIVSPHFSSSTHTFHPLGSQSRGRGCQDFAKRKKLLNALVDGTLVVEVHMNPHEPIKATLPQFVPENPFCNNMLQLFNDEESSDIVFAVGEHRSKNNAEKVAKIAPVTFYAHRLIVRACSAILAGLCDSAMATTPIEITGVSPEVFRHLLYYIYGGKISDDDMKSCTKEIINAANRYGVATLKLEAEACLVVGTTFSLENVMEQLIYGDSMGCALLKEVAMDFVVKNKAEVLEKTSFVNAPGNLMQDLLAAVVRGEKRTSGGRNKVNALRIYELRCIAHERGLDVDGSREMLIASIKESSKESNQISLIASMKTHMPL